MYGYVVSMGSQTLRSLSAFESVGREAARAMVAQWRFRPRETESAMGEGAA